MSAAPVRERREHRPGLPPTQPLRVLYVTHSLAPIGREDENLGGMQRTAQDLHAALGRISGVELHTCGLRTTARTANLQTPGFVAWVARSLLDTVTSRNIDVVLFTSLVTAAAAVPVSRRLRHHGVAVTSIVHGRAVTRRSGVLRWVLPRVFNSIDTAFPVSAGTAAACAARGMDPARMTVVPNGVNLDRFAEPTDRSEARAALLESKRSLTGDGVTPELIVCGVGRHIERKGFAWFVTDVMPRLPPGVQFWLGGHGPETGAIRQAVVRAGIADRVVLLGQLSERELTGLYQGADLFVMPNVEIAGDFEGFGVVMLEAGASGVPVVASRLEGITDVVTEGETGHLVESRDAEAFAAIIRDYHDDPAARSADGARAAAAVRARFGWAGIAERYVAHLRRIAAETARRAQGSVETP